MQAHKELYYEASRNSSQGLATRIDVFNTRMDSGIQEMWQETMKQKVALNWGKPHIF